MMTDERIKEEFEKWHQKLLTTDERAFFEQFPTDNYEIACGFYAGFRAAERLAKIEVLEDLKERSRSCTYAITTEKIIDKMIHDLKAGQDAQN